MAAAGSAATSGLALITGANRGIGLEVARVLAKDGMRVLLAGRSAALVDEAVAAVREADSSARVEPVIIDLADQSTFKHATEAVRSTGQPLALLVNNGAIYEDGWTEMTFRRHLDTNFLGTLALTEELLPVMQDGARIINVSSGYGQERYCPAPYREAISAAKTLDSLRDAVKTFVPDPAAERDDVAAYKLSKRALNRATQILAGARELRDRGITVAAVCPGWVRTRMGGSDATRSIEQGANSILATIREMSTSRVNGGFFRDGFVLRW